MTPGRRIVPRARLDLELDGPGEGADPRAAQLPPTVPVLAVTSLA